MNTTRLTHRARWALAAAVAVLAGTGLWALAHRGAEAAETRKSTAALAVAVAVTTTTVKAEDVPLYRPGIGSVTPAATVTVKARIDGQLDQVGFSEGQDVKAGQVLARIDPRTLQAQLMQVQALRARDQAQAANARADLQRYTTLLAQDAATRQQVDTQKALVAQLDATVRTDDAQVNYAQVQLGFTTITAPIGGRVGARLVDPGNIVHAADAGGLVVINQIDPVSVVFTLPEDAVQDINQAQDTSRQPLAVQAFAREGNALLGTGKLTLLNNQIDAATGTVQLKASFPNPRRRLWPGQFVNVRLVLGIRRQSLTVPSGVVQRSQAGLFAYVVEPDGKTVRSRPISVLQIEDGVAVIDKGLAAGERVVVDGQYKLKPGARILETARAASAPASATATVATAGTGARP